MELAKLKYFLVVAKEQHVTKAAEYLCIAQPALTQAIKSLERELGVNLFEKRGRNVVLTEYGKYLQNRLENLLPEFDKIPGEIENLKNKVNKTIKINIKAASTFVINAIVKYTQKNKDVVFEFEQSDLSSDCDILITTDGAKSDKSILPIQSFVKEEQIYLAVPKNSVYANFSSIELSVVKNEKFIMFSSSMLFGVICNKYCSKSGFQPNITFESDSPSAVQNIISTGIGVAFWPEFSWGKTKNKNVVLIPITKPNCKRNLIFELYSKKTKSKYAENFFNFLIEQI